MEVPPELSLAQVAPWGPGAAPVSRLRQAAAAGPPQRLGLSSSQMQRVKAGCGPTAVLVVSSPSAFRCVGCRDKGQKCSDSRSPKGV